MVQDEKGTIVRVRKGREREKGESEAGVSTSWTISRCASCRSTITTSCLHQVHASEREGMNGKEGGRHTSEGFFLESPIGNRRRRHGRREDWRVTFAFVTVDTVVILLHIIFRIGTQLLIRPALAFALRTDVQKERERERDGFWLVGNFGLVEIISQDVLWVTFWILGENESDGHDHELWTREVVFFKWYSAKRGKQNRNACRVHALTMIVFTHINPNDQSVNKWFGRKGIEQKCTLRMLGVDRRKPNRSRQTREG